MAWSKNEPRTRSTTGSRSTSGRVSRASWPGATAAIAKAVFDQAQQHKEQLLERLRQGPGPKARLELELPEPVQPSRWKLRTIRASLPWLSGYSLSGLWRVLERYGLSLRSGQLQHYSTTDPDYARKQAVLMRCREEAARYPKQVAFLFLDEMGYYRWPEAAPDWAAGAPRPAPLAQRQESKQKQWRVIGALNALTGQVNYLDGYVVARKKVIEMYHRIERLYSSQRQIYVAQDNWSIHKHPEVEAALAELPGIEPVWLPTYAPWLNPIEKLWRWLKEDVLKMHRLAGHWQVLRESVNGFLDQFAEGSERLLRYVGLRGGGKMARIIQGP